MEDVEEQNSPHYSPSAGDDDDDEDMVAIQNFDHDQDRANNIKGEPAFAEIKHELHDDDDDDDDRLMMINDNMSPPMPPPLAHESDQQVLDGPESCASGDLEIDTYSMNGDLNTANGPSDSQQESSNKIDRADSNPTPDPNTIWTLPADKDVCTLEEIRRGQVVNKVAPNQCPVIGCGKKINEMSLDPTPGTIASGLRTHVLFVHYANLLGRKAAAKKRKPMNWTGKRRGAQLSPRKQFLEVQKQMTAHLITNDQGLDLEPENCAISSFEPTGLNLIQRSKPNQTRPSPGSLLNKKVKQLNSKRSVPSSSLQSMIQASGSNLPSGGASLLEQHQNSILKNQQDSSELQKSFNQTTSSLFSILAGLTQPQAQQQEQQYLSTSAPQTNIQQNPPTARNIKTAHKANTVNVTQCSRNINSNGNNSLPVNSSLLSLLNEKISGNVASSLQSQLKKSLYDSNNMKAPISTSDSRLNIANSANNAYYPNINDTNNYNNNGSSILSSLCSGNNDSRLLSFDCSLPLNSFIESIALKTGSNIGPAGVAEARKIIEKFATSLVCNSQTIADHYVTPYSSETPQQKPEISPSDVILAYKMMQKSSTQP